MDPTFTYTPISNITIEDDDITVITSNVSDGTSITYQTVSSASAPKIQSSLQAVFTIAPNDAIADLGAKQIFVMEGTPVLNKQITTCPLSVALADGCWVMSTHMCDIVLPGLPTTLVGHIVPELSIASLFGIRVLTEAGCTVKFDNKKCVVKYSDKTILVGSKDPATDLWTLSIVGPAGKTTQVKHERMRDPPAVPVCAGAHACGSEGKAMTSLNPPPPSNHVSFFTHTVRTKANSIKFAHQSLCSPQISTLLKAIRRGFL